MQPTQTTIHSPSPSPGWQMNPVLVMLTIVVIAFLMTYFVNSGQYEREGKKVIPGSYQTITKQVTVDQVLGIEKPAENEAAPVSLLQLFKAIPEGIIKQSPLIYMVLFIGGMFGILNKTGAIESGLERLLHVTRGNIYLLIPFLMIVFSMGSTFMGLAKEYLLVIPMVIALMKRVGLNELIGLAIVAIAVKVGYLASITNPYALSIAQPLVGLPVFSGLSMRVAAYFVFITLGILFVFYSIRKTTLTSYVVEEHVQSSQLTRRHKLMLIVLAIGVAFLVYASNRWHWKNNDLSAYYLFLSVILTFCSGLTASAATDAFVSGMKKVLIAGVLIGLATAVEIILSQGKILDTIIHQLVGLVGDHGAYISSYSMFLSQLLLDVAIPSTSGQAAVTMPILGPVGEISGVSPQTTVFAFLMGNGLTNMITPTSSGLLIFLATAGVSWTTWAKYIFPLFLIFMAVGIGLLTIAVTIGY